MPFFFYGNNNVTVCQFPNPRNTSVSLIAPKPDPGCRTPSDRYKNKRKATAPRHPRGGFNQHNARYSETRVLKLNVLRTCRKLSPARGVSGGGGSRQGFGEQTAGTQPRPFPPRSAFVKMFERGGGLEMHRASSSRLAAPGSTLGRPLGFKCSRIGWH